MPTTQGQGNPTWSFEETILALNILQKHNFRVPGKTSEDVRGLSAFLQTLPIHPLAGRDAHFRNIASVYLKLQNLKALHVGRGLRSSVTDKAVWNAYWQHPAEVRRLAAEIESAQGFDQGELDAVDNGEELFSEGRLLTAIHRRRERAQGLRAQVIARERRVGLACGACGRGPAITSRGPEMEAATYEVHHLKPLSDLGPTQTHLSDLVLLCATCHRLIHRLIRLERRWCDIEDLRAALQI